VTNTRNKITTTVYITPEQDAKLKTLSAKTRVPVAAYIRDGIDFVLAQHSELLPAQLHLFGKTESTSEGVENAKGKV
jgi:hypothetical protein